MDHSRSRPLRKYLVHVSYFSADDLFATESHAVRAANKKLALREGLRLSTESIYDDPRVPDLHRAIIAEPAGSR